MPCLLGRKSIIFDGQILYKPLFWTCYIWKLQQKKQKHVTWKNPASGYPCLPSLRSARNHSFARGKTSEKDFASESWIHAPQGTENTWIRSRLFLLLPDTCACLRNATLAGIAEKPNTVINFSKDSNGEAAAQATRWPFMWPSGVSSSPRHVSGEGHFRRHSLVGLVGSVPQGESDLAKRLQANVFQPAWSDRSTANPRCSQITRKVWQRPEIG